MPKHDKERITVDTLPNDWANMVDQDGGDIASPFGSLMGCFKLGNRLLVVLRTSSMAASTSTILALVLGPVAFCDKNER